MNRRLCCDCKVYVIDRFILIVKLFLYGIYSVSHLRWFRLEGDLMVILGRFAIYM